MTPKLNKILVFYYEGFAEFEIALSLLLLDKCDISYVGLEKKPYQSNGNQTFTVNQTMNEIDPLEIDLFIIPGGDSSPLYKNGQLKEFIKSILDNEKTVAGICGGSELLAGMGLLEGINCTGNTSGILETDEVYPYYQSAILSNEEVVIDGNIITAQGQAYAEFAVVLAKHIGILENDLEVAETLNWLKNKRGSDGEVTYLKPMNGWIDISESVKVSTSGFEECNMTLIVSEGEAVLVDAGLEVPEAERILKYIKKHQLELKHIVITHHHPDHVANLSLFEDITKSIYDAENASDASLWIGKKEMKLIHTPGHFPEGDISVLVCDEQILIAGDILYSCLPPQLSYGANPLMLSATLKKLSQMELKWVVPGHGKVMVADEIFSMSLSYIHQLTDEIKRGIASHEPLEKIAKIELSECIEHYDWMVKEPSLDLHRQNIKELYETYTTL